MGFEIIKAMDKYIGGAVNLVVGGVVWLWNGLFGSELEKPKRILVIKLWAIGDAIATLPLIESIKKSYPKTQIDVLCRKRNEAIFSTVKGVGLLKFESDGILDVLGAFRRYDLVFDTEPYMNLSAFLGFYLGDYRIGFRHGIRALLYDKTICFERKQHVVDHYLDMGKTIGVKPAMNSPRLIVPKEVMEKADSLIKENDLKDFIVIAPGVGESASETRKWKPERFAELADRLSRKGIGNEASILLIGGKRDHYDMLEIVQWMKHKERVRVFAGDTTILETAAIMKRARVVVAVDSGPMHLAAAVGARTIGLFGPNTPTLWKPHGDKGYAIYHQMSCSPCILNEKGIMPDCLRKTDKYACMNAITVEEVTKKVREIMTQ